MSLTVMVAVVPDLETVTTVVRKLQPQSHFDVPPGTYLKSTL
jgi:hypothetical protein